MRKIILISFVLVVFVFIYSNLAFAYTPYYGDFRYHELDFNTLGTYKEFPQNEVKEFTDAAYGNGIYVAVGAGEEVTGIGRGIVRNNPAIYYSKDKKSWTKAQLSEKAAILNSVIYANGIFVAVGESDRVSGNERYGSYIATSKDGINWTDRVVAGSPKLAGPLAKIEYANGIFLAEGDWDGPELGTRMLYSKDAVNWNGSYAPYGGSLYTDGSKFAMIGFQKIYTSKDGVAWNKVYTFDSIIDNYGFDSVSLNYVNGKWKGYSIYDKILDTSNGDIQLDSTQKVMYELESSDLINWTSTKIDYFMSNTGSDLLGKITNSDFRVIDLHDNSDIYLLIDGNSLRYIKTKNPSDIVPPTKPADNKPTGELQDKTGVFIIYSNNSSYRMDSYKAYLYSLLDEYKMAFGEDASLSSDFETNALMAEEKLRNSGKAFGFQSESDFEKFISGSESNADSTNSEQGIKYQLLAIDGKLRTYSELKSVLQSKITDLKNYTYPITVREVNVASDEEDNDRNVKFKSLEELLTFFDISYDDSTQKPVQEGNTIIFTIGNPTMIVNGEKRAIDNEENISPIIYNEKTLLPIRSIIESFGGTVDWDGVDKVTIKYNGVVIETRINNKMAYVNGRAKLLDVPPIIINNKTMVPVRFVAENLGINVNWDEKTRSVTLTK